jgi:hypothetical protein
MKRHVIFAAVACSLLAPLPLFAQGTGTRPKTPPVVDPFENDAPAPKEAAKKVDLRPKFEKGQVIKFRMELDQTSKTLVPALDEKPTESTSKQDLGLVFKVLDVTNEGTVVELTFSRVKMTKKTDEGTEEFDSSQPPAKDKGSELAPSLRALAKTSMTVHLDKDGNVTNIEGGDELSSLEAFGGSPGALPGGGGGGLPSPSPSTGGGGAGGGGGFKAALGSIFSIKKGSGLVSVGEEWSNSDDLDTGLLGKFRIADKHKLKSHNGSEAKVSVMGHIEADSSDGALSFVKITDSSFVGDYTWNTREGMLKRMNMHQHVVLESSAAGGLKLTSDMKSVVTRTN